MRLLAAWAIGVWGSLIVFRSPGWGTWVAVLVLSLAALATLDESTPRRKQ